MKARPRPDRAHRLVGPGPDDAPPLWLFDDAISASVLAAELASGVAWNAAVRAKAGEPGGIPRERREGIG